MVDVHHDWITIHRARYPAARGPESQTYGDADIASCARIGFDSVIGTDGLLIPTSDIWAGWCIHENLADAEATMAAAESLFPFLTDAEETWHALLLPIAHRGEVNWRGHVEVGTALRVGPDPGGLLAVMTTAGFDSMEPEELPRIKTFLERVWKTRASMAKAAGNVRTAIFASCDARDGITVTLWQNDSSMVSAAYGAGEHHAQLMNHRTEPLFDRSSFTRARVVSSFGTWDGGDPRKEVETSAAQHLDR
jgi:hypothetical protein